MAVGNRDDDLRNHGFLLTPAGWRLAPAFDMNPNLEKAAHVLNLDEHDNRPSLSTVIDTSEWYLSSKDHGDADPKVMPGMAGAAYGFAGMGPYSGGQAEYLRVPYGDYNCLKLPEDATDKETDYVMLNVCADPGCQPDPHRRRAAGPAEACGADRRQADQQQE